MTSMTEDTTYNGWKNYPTWCVNLWLSNDEGLYNATLELVSSQRTMNPELEMPGLERGRVADYLKEWVREMVERDDASVASDLLGYALDTVDWFEIADAWIETLSE